MDKPQKHTTTFYDYSECRDYLENKYGYDERDYAKQQGYYTKALKIVTDKYGKSWYNKQPKNFNEADKVAYEEYNKLLESKPPYRDFWHFVCDHHEINNGGYIFFSSDDLKYYKEDGKIEDWQAEIYQRYLDEFAENGELKLYVSW